MMKKSTTLTRDPLVATHRLSSPPRHQAQPDALRLTLPKTLQVTLEVPASHCTSVRITHLLGINDRRRVQVLPAVFFATIGSVWEASKSDQPGGLTGFS